MTVSFHCISRQTFPAQCNVFGISKVHFKTNCHFIKEWVCDAGTGTSGLTVKGNSNTA